jgi:hypothetical protein
MEINLIIKYIKNVSRLHRARKLNNITHQLKLNSIALVCEPTIPTARPPPVGKVSANFADIGVSRGQRNGSPRPLISAF